MQQEGYGNNLNQHRNLILQTGGNLTENHIGGCVLFEHKEEIESFVKEI